jgi:hypothetical protein
MTKKNNKTKMKLKGSSGSLFEVGGKMHVTQHALAIIF